VSFQRAARLAGVTTGGIAGKGRRDVTSWLSRQVDSLLHVFFACLTAVPVAEVPKLDTITA